MKARFEASLSQYIIRLLGWIAITLITFGIGGVWVAYDQTKWPIEHSSLGDRKVTFTATFVDFLGKLLLWLLVSLITLGIGSIWVAYDAARWTVDHIEVDGQRFTFQGTFAEYLGKLVIWFVVTLVTFGLGGVWVGYDALRWIAERSRYGDAASVAFTSTFTEFIGKVVIWFLVTMVTFGIGGIWASYDYYRWLADKLEVRQSISNTPLLASA